MAALSTIRIATRTSALALWQANAVKTKLEETGYSCEIVPVESTGDLQLTRPIYEMGITGVFTKELDTALLNNAADIAVHSLKDVPTQLAENLVLAAVLERGASQDVVLIKDKSILESKTMPCKIATSSLRRKAQWLAKYPHHEVVPIRGNVQTRLKKYKEQEDLQAVIFAKAGLERLNILPEDAVTLDWMVPAPAQGIIGIICRSDDAQILRACKKINHEPSFIAGHIERQFLRTLMGGCSVPISAQADIHQNELGFYGTVHSFNGREYYNVYLVTDLRGWKNFGKEAAENLLKQEGAPELLELIRNKKWGNEGTVN